MTTYIALFRGINVGGANVLPMKELRTLLEGLGCRDVRTYIQSGNAVFAHPGDAASLANEISGAVHAAKGFEPRVLLLSQDDLIHAAERNPFPDAVSEPSRLHIAFCERTPEAPDLATIDALRANGERCELIDGVFYLHAPAGIGRSKLAARVERLLGVATTGRNWRTVQKVLALAQRAE